MLKKYTPIFLVVTTFLAAQVPVPPAQRTSNPIMESIPEMPPRKKNDTYIRNSNGKYQLFRGDNNALSDLYDDLQYVSSDNKAEKVYIARKGKQYGLLDSLGKPLGAFEFDHIKMGNDDNIFAQKKGLWGILSKKGESIVPHTYATILFYNSRTNQLVASKNGSEYKIYSGTKEQKIPTTNIKITKVGILYQKDGKWNIINGNDKNILPQSYDEIRIIGYLNHDLVIPNTKITYIQTPHPHFLVKNDKYWGIINEEGKVVAPIEFDEISYDASKSIYNLRKDKYKGLYLPGEKPVLINAEYTSIHPSYSNVLIASKNGKYGLLDRTGKLLLPFQYERMMEYSKDKYLVTQNGKEGMVDSKGKILIAIENDDVSSFGGFNFTNYYTIKKNNLYGIVKGNGQTILPPKYDWVGDYEKIIVGQINRQWILYDEDGTQILPQPIDYLERNYSDHPIFYMIKDGKYGLIDSHGKIIAPPIYKELDYMYDENNLKSITSRSPLVITDAQNKKALFDEHRKNFILQFVYDDFVQTDGKNIIAKKGTKYGVIDTKNTIIIPFVYDGISLELIDAKNEEFVVKKGSKYGVVNAKNEVKIPLEYQKISKVSSKNIYKASKGKGYQLIDSNNTILNEGPFEDILNFENNEALAFQKGTMVKISQEGKIHSTGIASKAPNAYTTFDELKQGLVIALNAKDDAVLKTFASKIAPNPAMLYYLKDVQENRYDHLDINEIIDTYYKALLRFKTQEWQTNRYEKRLLTDVKDFVYSDYGTVTAVRNSLINDFRDEFITDLLKGTLKINGFWYSTYFLKNNFGRY